MENGNADLQIDGLLRLAEPWLAHLQKHYLDDQYQIHQFPTQWVPLAEQIGVQEIAQLRLVIGQDLPLPDNPQLLEAGRATGLFSEDLQALTIGHTIFYKSPDGEIDPALLAHELVHVTQAEKMGFDIFLRSYIEQLLRSGYRDAPLEKEARLVESSVRRFIARGEYNDHLRLKVEAGRAAMRVGQGRSNDEVEAEFAAKRRNLTFVPREPYIRDVSHGASGRKPPPEDIR